MSSPEENAALAAELAEKEAAARALAAEIAALRKRLGGPVSPLAPARFPALAPVAGVTLAADAAGVRYKGRDDVMLVRLEAGSVLAGTFTRSSTRAAPVLWCEARLAALATAAPAPRAIVVNSGNANAFTGAAGTEAVERVARATADALGLAPGDVMMASTGVIGEPLPAERIEASLSRLAAGLSTETWERAARAIMTTDTFPKGATATVEIGGTPVTVSGFAKGSGMIAPDMATMLVFIFTDAAVRPPVLQALVSALTEQTFNAITVDSDTSTSDTLIVGATGQAPMAPIERAESPEADLLRGALGTVMRDLAIQVVKDGEGATKLAEITVTGAESDRAARKVGLAIANSPLVKTALAGEDPNWGRIVMAVGKSGEKADRDRLSIRFGDIPVAEAGWVAPAYSEAAGAAYMRRQELEIGVDLGVGPGRATVWTCDLTKRYVEINADYRS
ncbi:bifunctional glutamate N-acetyltransferase/amino-acid acetyltransferase ArgJ [Paralimibaculum aggregatum]|uniref:Arginine biosynthesis bifunctional protein ArgJ n=1 Tax=Paralimibaculum aggregatum TaxID=3036245 RepID=A0ABQ6LCJ8_9RHOB|nr:bifunctional glutamate N-acetyltransferase/amino-acid acetyltransferase ArgJ [Limibaculum sp. NKW23]GMG81105.1 bifunctional glutamate N-acetyltransferase/amino-acid acetyltransferase ArgJ [Limibaculum sp. NKW23]